ncbi:hypothetical protein [Anabaena sp. FACHB-1237]|uniref:hypothetical protein n=1 Tax=Anabaena sp. FACHB-1237 TaxID=2692769 RepID=UPI001F54AC83|nr:hypothetical protein [Anabaena sp. FACHB-1237]
MNYLELHQKIEKQISHLPPEQLSLVSDFLDSIQEKITINQRLLRRISPLSEVKKQVIYYIMLKLGKVMIWKIVCV